MAMSLNRATIIGNLTRDPEMRTIPSGQNVTSFGVATNRSYNDREGNKRDEVQFHNIVAWGKLAEICNQFLGKGRKVYIEGRLQTRDWEGQDGQRRNRTEIVAENMIMLDKSGAPQGGGASSGFQRKPAGSSGDLPTISIDDAPVSNSDDKIKIEDIPF